LQLARLLTLKIKESLEINQIMLTILLSLHVSFMQLLAAFQMWLFTYKITFLAVHLLMSGHQCCVSYTNMTDVLCYIVSNILVKVCFLVFIMSPDCKQFCTQLFIPNGKKKTMHVWGLVQCVVWNYARFP